MKSVLFLCDGWRSSAGGIQTVNRELCRALGKLSKENTSYPKITCWTTNCTKKDIEEAALANVKLISVSEECLTEDDDSILEMRTKELCPRQFDVIVGHSRFTGFAAINLRKVYPKSKIVVFVHMDSEDVEQEKSDSEQLASVILAGERSKKQRDVICGADTVVAIGPRLARFARGIVQTAGTHIKVVELTCGMISSVKPRTQQPCNPVVLYVGRTKQVRQKGLDILTRAAGQIAERYADGRSGICQKLQQEPVFHVRGVAQDALKSTTDKFAKESLEQVSRKFKSRIKMYTTNSSDIVNDFLCASVLVMPSRVEGFGLVAVEAANHGVPIIVSKNSGVGEMLLEELKTHTLDTSLTIFDITEHRKDVDSLSESIEQLLIHPERARKRALWVRDFLLNHCLWDEAAFKFLREVVDLPYLPALETQEVSFFDLCAMKGIAEIIPP